MAFDGRKTTDYDALTRRVEQAKKEERGKRPLATVKKSLSNTVTDNDSLYAYNNTYIDVRTPNDEKRGLITLFLGGAGVILLSMLIGFSYAVLSDWMRGHTGSGAPIEIYNYFFDPLFPAIPASGLFVYIKYCSRYLHLDIFTARRLIVRFNRITRKVYLLRPKNLGGIVALDWDKTEAAVDRSMRDEVLSEGGFLILCWDIGAVYDAEGKLTDDFDGTFVGRTTADGSELLDFWEYIRRYMEIGPQAAPPPKRLLCKTPWPWLSFQAAWSILPLNGLRESGLFWMFVLVKLMLLPVTILHAIGHWISLLLCYEPKFPPAIENAGRANAVPKQE